MATKVIWNQKVVDDLMKGLGDKMELVGQVVESAAKDNCPVKSGRLKNSITHETDKTELTTQVGTDVEYAPFVELGTIKMGPRPFLRMALYENEKNIIEIMNK